MFIAQTWVAAILTPDPQALIVGGDPDGTAFYTAAQVAAGPWLATVCAVATAVAWGLPDSMVAQVAISRLLYAMARDRQLPAFLAKVSRERNVPRNAILLVAVASLTLGLSMSARGDGIALLSSLINFGALTAFLLPNASGSCGSVWACWSWPVCIWPGGGRSCPGSLPGGTPTRSGKECES
ncbi:hypothetical protein GCM10012284_04540 [Mangrovihabitans endophyticus]|uniref:Amino acid permease n=1 Tax=Mangrovihabitans endophyticus TaxID=1751298 RepID=A0A8J3BWC4_9ACTN|nr:hypothetical protein GCM10012284_04540 [Mangrovihabitans endophyticus]